MARLCACEIVFKKRCRSSGRGLRSSGAVKSISGAFIRLLRVILNTVSVSSVTKMSHGVISITYVSYRVTWDSYSIEKRGSVE